MQESQTETKRSIVTMVRLLLLLHQAIAPQPTSPKVTYVQVLCLLESSTTRVRIQICSQAQAKAKAKAEAKAKAKAEARVAKSGCQFRLDYRLMQV